MSSATHVTAPAAAPAPRPLRRQLLLLAATGLFPVAIGAAMGVGYVVHERYQAAQHSALELSRALATAVDAELAASTAVLQTLATSGYLAEGRLAEFRRHADRVASMRGWHAIELSDARGQLALSTAVRSDSPLPPALDAASLRRVVLERRPVVGSVSAEAAAYPNAFRVRVPVLKDGEVANVLTGVIATDQLLNLLTKQQVPPGWVVGIFDQSGERVARTRSNATTRPSRTMQALLDTGAPEGMGPTRTLEGVPSFSAFSRLQDSGWVVASAVSRREVELAMLPLLLSLAAGLLASLLLAIFMARHLGRRVLEPIQTLKTAALALGRGEPVALPALPIAELDEVAVALGQASAERAFARAQREQSDLERERLLERISHTLRAAEAANRSKDEFLAMLGHELRNPLAPLSSALQLLDLKCGADTRPEREVLHRQLKHMVRLVDDLLDVSRITSKRLTISLEPLQPAGIVESAVEATRALAGSRSLQLRIDPAAAGAWIRGDDVRLSQVLHNLLGNAVKFTSPSGRIDVAMFLHERELWIEVRDDGLGMSPEVLDLAFAPFFQAPQTMDRPRGGLGLGLSIVKSLIEMHGGRVCASSAGAGLGSTVRLILPCVAPPAVVPAQPDAQLGIGEGRVLVVDDNQDAAETTAALLCAVGYEVRVAYDPRTALDLASAFDPDAVVLDIGLPGMSGYQVAAALHAPPHRFTGLLVALTGFGEPGDVARALACGFDAHLTKPVGPQPLLDALKRRARPVDQTPLTLS